MHKYQYSMILKARFFLAKKSYFIIIIIIEGRLAMGPPYLSFLLIFYCSRYILYLYNYYIITRYLKGASLINVQYKRFLDLFSIHKWRDDIP